MSNELRESIESFRVQSAPIAKALQDCVEKMRPTTVAIAEAADQFRRQYEPVVKQFAETYGPKIQELVIRAKQWQEDQKISVALLAERGWFPNWYTFYYSPTEEFESIDDLMIAQIDEHWDEIKQNIIELSPNREHILSVAFELHEQENYIASIPLILSQSDGICSEDFTHFFSKDSNTGRRASDEIILQAESNELVVDFLSEILLEPFKVNLQLSQGSSKANKAAKKKGPNRHGIIHGSRKHLDYGSKVNGYKAISFLAFIVYTTKDKFKKT